MVETPMLHPKSPHPEPRQRRPRPLSRDASPGSNWRGPHFARLDAWFARRERLLAELVGGSAPLGARRLRPRGASGSEILS